MLPYIAEFLGTLMLILIGDGVVANVTLNKSGMKGAGSIQITLAWGLGVMGLCRYLDQLSELLLQFYYTVQFLGKIQKRVYCCYI